MQTASMTEVLCHTSMKLNENGKFVAAKDVEKIVNAALEARATEIFHVLTEKYDDLDKMIESLNCQKIEMDMRWAGELSRRFLPKFVVNLSSNKTHAVRDAECTGCGYEWRNARDHDLLYELKPDSNLCDKGGCQKLFKRYAQ